MTNKNGRISAKDNNISGTYRESFIKPNTQKDLCELMEISITKRSARSKNDTFSQRDIPRK